MTRNFWKRFIGAWLIALFSLQLTRLVFYLNLKSYFDGSVEELVNAFLIGIEFDAVTIAYLLGPFFIALPFIKPGWSTNISKWFFVLMLGAMNFLNCSDAEFFKFTARRSTDDIFEFAFLSNDIFNIAPSLVNQFWHFLLAVLLIMLFSFWIINRILTSDCSKTKLWVRSLAIIPIALTLVIAARGGFQPIPLSIIDAGNIKNPQLSAVALSTPFTIIKTIGKPELKRFEFPTNEMVEINPIRRSGTKFTGNLKNNNVVIIIVESLSAE
jgi:phosphoglycerol transferase MdoB-like AlkP superfamily enzyme